MNHLLEQFGSPLYVYDAEVIRDRINHLVDFKNTLEKSLDPISISLHYSSKANSNPAILKLVKEAGLSVDAMSPFELYLNEKCGFQNNNILYVCNNIDEEEMRLVHDKDILICLDSISQVEMWGRMFPNTKIMIRINPNIKGVGHSSKVVTSGKETKFGISEENFSLLFEVIHKYHLTLVGVHQHLGSLFLNDKISDYIDGVKASLDIIKRNFTDLEIIDLGGGFGVPYRPDELPLDFKLLSSLLLEVLKPFVLEYPSLKEIKFEPGRYIPCEAGTLVGKVNAIKYENGKYWIGTDLGMNQLIRPSMYDAYHEVQFIYQDSNKTLEDVANICGNVCESGDIIARDRNIKIPSVGDIVLVKNAGAYGYSMSSNYTGRARPCEVMIDKDKIFLIRKRETIEDLESKIVW